MFSDGNMFVSDQTWLWIVKLVYIDILKRVDKNFFYYSINNMFAEIPILFTIIVHVRETHLWSRLRFLWNTALYFSKYSKKC